MPFVQHDMQALIVTSPKAAKEKVLGALKSNGVHMMRAATALGCSHATLLRWIKALDLLDATATMKAKALKEGWYEGHQGGRPRGSDVASGAAPRGTYTKAKAKAKPKASERSDAARAR